MIITACSRPQLAFAIPGIAAAQYCSKLWGFTAAFKLVADCFPWTAGSRFAYVLDNHTSVVGMREVALAAGATVCPADLVSRSGASALIFSGKTSTYVPRILDFTPANAAFIPYCRTVLSSNLSSVSTQILHICGLDVFKFRWLP